MTTDSLQLMLVIYFLAMSLLAAFYLRGRALSLLEYTAWGIIAILLPGVGPFLVIWMHPGQTKGTDKTQHLLS
jgi:hypothetical protein